MGTKKSISPITLSDDDFDEFSDNLEAVIRSTESRLDKEKDSKKIQSQDVGSKKAVAASSNKRILATPSSNYRHSLPKMVISQRQEHNPILKYVRNVPYEFGDILADYQVGLTVGVLFLSLKYHRLHPEYLMQRVKMLGRHFQQRVLLVLVDIDDHVATMQEVTRFCITHELLLIMATTNEEAARYLETFKAFENKNPDIIKTRTDNSYISNLTGALTQIKGINKTDVVTLLAAFGSFENIINSSADELALCSGFGELKIQRLLAIFNEPFRYDKRKTA